MGDVRKAEDPPRLQEALEYYQKALAIDKRNEGQSAHMAEDLLQIGSVHSKTGDVRKALQAHKESSKINQHCFGKDDPEVAKGLISIGDVYRQLGQLQKALVYFEQGFQVLQLNSIENAEMSNVMTAIGEIKQKMGQELEALRLFKRALVIDRGLHGESHPDCARNMYNIGTIRQHEKKLEESLHFLQQAYDIRLRILGHNHPSVADTVFMIGHNFRLEGKMDEALKNYQDAIRAFKTTQGHELDVAKVLRSIGFVYEHKHDWGQAVKNHRENLRILQLVWGVKDKRVKKAEEILNKAIRSA